MLTEETVTKRFRRSMLSPDTTLRQAADLARDAALV